MRATTDRSPLIPYVVQRKGEEAAPDNLRILEFAPGRHRLYYADENPQRDRDMRGVLWARCAFNPADENRMPTGEPQWKMMHPHRQMVTMQHLRCQVCTRQARTRLGYIFLAGRGNQDPTQAQILTNQPPVCAQHAPAAAQLCPHLAGDPIVFLAHSAPLYGVGGVLYGRNSSGVHVVARPDHALPYGHPNLETFLASQMVRRLSSFRVVSLEELLKELAAA
ncbi:hypothetical protein [Streptomyces sp. NPDC050564]|uniref:hypothetical protein n=1 Tax=Streptomyces sp. NPDC050564 TaxID=3365631 RepID=UPI0037A07AF1